MGPILTASKKDDAPENIQSTTVDKETDVLSTTSEAKIIPKVSGLLVPKDNVIVPIISLVDDDELMEETEACVASKAEEPTKTTKQNTSDDISLEINKNEIPVGTIQTTDKAVETDADNKSDYDFTDIQIIEPEIINLDDDDEEDMKQNELKQDTDEIMDIDEILDSHEETNENIEHYVYIENEMPSIKHQQEIPSSIQNDSVMAIEKANENENIKTDKIELILETKLENKSNEKEKEGENKSNENENESDPDVIFLNPPIPEIVDISDDDDKNDDEKNCKIIESKNQTSLNIDEQEKPTIANETEEAIQNLLTIHKNKKNLQIQESNIIENSRTNLNEDIEMVPIQNLSESTLLNKSEDISNSIENLKSKSVSEMETNAPQKSTNPEILPDDSEKLREESNVAIEKEVEKTNNLKEDFVIKDKETEKDKNEIQTDKCQEIVNNKTIEQIIASTSVQHDKSKQQTIPPIIEQTINKNDVDTNRENKITDEQTKGKLKERTSYECSNFFCKKESKTFYLAPRFILSYFGIKLKPKKSQFICSVCFDQSTNKYEELCGVLLNHKTLLAQNLPRQADLVEISSSDDEDNKKKILRIKEATFLSIDDNELLEHLNNILPETLKRVSIDKQMKWNNKILTESFEENERNLEQLTEKVAILGKRADEMSAELYKQESFKIKRLPPLNLDSACIQQKEGFDIPTDGILKRPPINKDDVYLAAHKENVSWSACKVLDIIETHAAIGTSSITYNIKFKRQKGIIFKILSGKHLAYYNESTERFPIGCRVVATFSLDKTEKKSKTTSNRNHYFPGIVAETVQQNTKYRYLIFFDDGYTKYIKHENIRLVCDASINVWEDVLESSRAFIHEYLMESHRRAMVQVRKGHRITTEYKGHWLPARVTDIDCSLVQLYFEKDKRYEWIYRGSMRLAPLFRERQNAKLATPPQLLRRNEPFVEYIVINDDFRPKVTKKTTSFVQTVPQKVIPSRAVAKKSTIINNIVRNQIPISLNRHEIVIDSDIKAGKIKYFRVTNPRVTPKQFIMHNCSPNCCYNVQDIILYGPLVKPILYGWERQLATKTRSNKKKDVIYKGPCGKRIRNMTEIYNYLKITKSPLNVEHFDFNPALYSFCEWDVEQKYERTSDLSGGLERMKISCVNYFDSSLPPPCVYSVRRVPTEGVNLNLDKSFLCGCTCTDDCKNKEKCECWQLTIAGAKYKNPNIEEDCIGYEFKRLLDPVPTGIYECNSRCKCNQRCLNRVAQHPLNIRLQVFKTRNRGWGLRTLIDIPKGGFICIYAGHLLTEQKANEGGATDGDEYFADLDYIEVVERLKEGYESDVPEGVGDSSNDESQAVSKNYDSDTEFKANLSPCDPTTLTTRSSTRLQNKGETSINDLYQKTSEITISETNFEKNLETTHKPKPTEEDCITISDDEDERVPVNFMPDASMLDMDDDDMQSRFKSVRKMYGRNEYSYIMDAKKTGNVGRYFNHSCQPNLFVQNVFVDTHDLRFPWVAFFAIDYIPCGSELTWNYNYDVGSVPGKVLFCECGAKNCRGRLL